MRNLKAKKKIKRRSGEGRKSAARKKRLAAIVGWREWAALPALGIDEIKVKIDTGARTSALHAFNVVPFARGGEDWVRFDVHPLQRNDRFERRCEARVVDYRWVTNSGGQREKRFVIETVLALGRRTWPIEITLSDRDQMGFRMLVGRTGISGRFIVDPSRSYCASREQKRGRGKETIGPSVEIGPSDEEE